MAAKNKNFLTNFKKDPKTNKVYFVGNYMEVYIPENYFPTMAEVIGDKINTLGIFLYRIFSNREKKETVKLGVYKFPSILTTKPSDLEKKKLDFNGK